MLVPLECLLWAFPFLFAACVLTAEPCQQFGVSWALGLPSATSDLGVESSLSHEN